VSDLCLLPAREVVDHGVEDLDVIIGRPEHSVASSAEQPPDSAGGMTVINGKTIRSSGVRGGWSFTDSTESTLINEQDFIVGFADAVSVSKVGIPPIFAVPFALGGEAFVSILFSSDFLARNTHPSALFFPDERNVNLSKTSSTPGSFGLGVDVGQTMASVEFSKTFPLALIVVDGNETTTATSGTTVLSVDVGQNVVDFSDGTMAYEKLNGLSFDSSSRSMAVGGDGSWLATTTMAFPVDVTVGVVAQTVVHRGDCTKKSLSMARPMRDQTIHVFTQTILSHERTLS
jgi:hypothetical protein